MVDSLTEDECVDDYNNCVKINGIQGGLAIIASAALGNPVIVIAITLGSGWRLHGGIKECKSILRKCLRKVGKPVKVTQ